MNKASAIKEDKVVDAQVLYRLMVVFIIAGLALSIYAATETAEPGLRGSCSVTAQISCKCVDESGHTTVGPIPDWSIGVAGFSILLLLYIPLMRTYDVTYLKGILLFSAIGIGFLAYFAYLEVFVIGCICPICAGTYASDLCVFVTGVYALRMRDQAFGNEEGGEKVEEAQGKRGKKGSQ